MNRMNFFIKKRRRRGKSNKPLHKYLLEGFSMVLLRYGYDYNYNFFFFLFRVFYSQNFICIHEEMAKIETFKDTWL